MRHISCSECMEGLISDLAQDDAIMQGPFMCQKRNPRFLFASRIANERDFFGFGMGTSGRRDENTNSPPAPAHRIFDPLCFEGFFSSKQGRLEGDRECESLNQSPPSPVVLLFRVCICIFMYRTLGKLQSTIQSTHSVCAMYSEDARMPRNY